MLVLGGVVPLSGTVVDSFFTSPNNDMSNGVTIDTAFETVVKDVPDQSGGATTGLGFIDSIKMLLGIFKFILSSLTAPFQLLFNPMILLPMTFRILVGLPLTIVYIFGLIGFLGGRD
jgi:hypothetical protein